MSTRPDTPNISADLIDEESQKLFNESVKECIEVLEGKRGDGLDRALTARDLSDAGVIKVTTSASDVSGEIDIVVPPLVTDVVEFPTGPTGLVVTGAFTNILLAWDEPTFSGFTSTEVWRYETNLLASSVLVATVEHYIYSEPVDPGSTYYYWIRHVNSLNQKSSFNSSSGTLGQTNRTVASILTDLNESIGISSLDAALSADISTIGTIGTSVTQHTSALGAISGEQYVRINNAGEVAGYGIAAGPTSSEFVVNAGLFKVGNGTESTPPFFIVTGAGMAFGSDGSRHDNKSQSWQQTNYPSGKWFAAGTYMETAMIADASIDTAKINNLSVDIATVTGTLIANEIAAISISADRITSGTIDADRIDAALLNVANMFLSGTLNVNNTNGAIAWGKTSGDDFNNTGLFFGRTGGQLRFNMGSSTSYIYFDGTTVQMVGTQSVAVAPAATTQYLNVGSYTRNLIGADVNRTIGIAILGGGGGGGGGLGSAGGAGSATTVKIKTQSGATRATYTASGGQGGPTGDWNYWYNQSPYNTWASSGGPVNDYGGVGQSFSQGGIFSGTGGGTSRRNGSNASGNGAGGGGFGDQYDNVASASGAAGAYTTYSVAVTATTDYIEITVGGGGGGGMKNYGQGDIKSGGSGVKGAAQIMLY